MKKYYAVSTQAGMCGGLITGVEFDTPEDAIEHSKICAEWNAQFGIAEYGYAEKTDVKRLDGLDSFRWTVVGEILPDCCPFEED